MPDLFPHRFIHCETDLGDQSHPTTHVAIRNKIEMGSPDKGTPELFEGDEPQARRGRERGEGGLEPQLLGAEHVQRRAPYVVAGDADVGWTCACEQVRVTCANDAKLGLA